MLSQQDIKIGHLYSAKSPRRAKGGLLNDRRVVELKNTVGGIKVSYRSPAVLVGHGFKETYTETYVIDGEEVEKERERTLMLNQPSTDEDAPPASAMMESFLSWAMADVTVLVDGSGWRK